MSHNRAIVVATSASAEEIQAYLYDHTRIVGQVFITSNNRRHLLLETTADTDGRASFLAKYQSERLANGLHGATVYADLDTAVYLHKELTGVDLSAFLPQRTTVRVLVAIDVPAEQAENPEDLLASIEARLIDEAGYLDTGDPVSPVRVTVTFVEDSTVLTPVELSHVYNVGVDGVED